MKENIQILQRFNAWCRGEETIDLPNPKQVGEAIDRLIDHVAQVEAARNEWKHRYEMAVMESQAAKSPIYTFTHGKN